MGLENTAFTFTKISSPKKQNGKINTYSTKAGKTTPKKK